MKATEQYVRLCGSLGHLSERVTGVSIVDAYFGTPELAPDRQRADLSPDGLRHELGVLADNIRSSIRNPLRKQYLLSEVVSMDTLAEWLGGASIPYGEFVERLFSIKMKAYSEGDIDRQTRCVEEAYASFPGGNLRDKVEKFDEDGKLCGQELKNLIEGELQQKASEVGRLFSERIFSKIRTKIPDKGVQYKTVTDRPWGAYNYYLGSFESLTVFNIDLPLKPVYLFSNVYHEYEHHVAGFCREYAFTRRRYPELSILPLHTGFSVILEGTADSAREFLGVSDEDSVTRALKAVGRLFSMVQVNAAIMMNVRGLGVEEVSEYISDRAFVGPDIAQAVTRFIRPRADNDRPSFWAPYIFTYGVGKRVFVLPTFNRAIAEGLEAEFFRTLYLNPFSRSSATWKKAFDWL